MSTEVPQQDAQVPHYVRPESQVPQWMPQPQPPQQFYPQYQQQQAFLPSVATTFWITLFFGLFGLIPASMHASRARAAGQSPAKYWKTFGWTYGASLVIGFLLLMAMGAFATHTSYYYNY